MDEWSFQNIESNMIYFCPKCWKEVPENSEMCPNCGNDLKLSDQRSYPEKLISALRHHDLTVVIRAARILVEIDHREAVPSLLTRAESELKSSRPNPYLLAALLAAARQLGAPEKKIRSILSRSQSHLLKRLYSSHFSNEGY
jgi:hypothetical protein